EGLRRRRVEDGVHDLNLEEVVPRAQASELSEPALTCAGSDGAGVGACERPCILAAREVSLDAEAAFDGVSRSLQQQAIEVALRNLPDTARSGPLRHARIECVHERIQTGSDGLELEVGDE